MAEAFNAKAQRRKDREVKADKERPCELCIFAMQAQSARLGRTVTLSSIKKGSRARSTWANRYAFNSDRVSLGLS